LMVVTTGADFEAQTGIFNFAQDDAAYYKGVNIIPQITTTGASYEVIYHDNVLYNNGTSGYEPIHVNDVVSGAWVYGNISSYSGGAGMALQTGDYNASVTGNLFFLFGADCINIFLDKSIVPANEVYETFSNNVCWSSLSSDSIRGSNPGDGSLYLSPSGHGPNYFVKNTTIQNNVIVGNWSSLNGAFALDFQTYSYPESSIIIGNQFWNTAAGNPQNFTFSIIALTSPTSIPGTYTAAQLNTCSNWSSSCTAGNYSGNTFANPNFPNAQESNLQNPGVFNFGIYNLR
jgi:hypothetical protein